MSQRRFAGKGVAVLFAGLALALPAGAAANPPDPGAYQQDDYAEYGHQEPGRGEGEADVRVTGTHRPLSRCRRIRGRSQVFRHDGYLWASSVSVRSP